MKSFLSPFTSYSPNTPTASTSAAECNLTFVHISHIAPGTTQDRATALFEKYGKITSANLYVDPEKLLPGFGYVKFEKHLDAVKAIKEVNGTMFDGVEVKVGFAGQHE